MSAGLILAPRQETSTSPIPRSQATHGTRRRDGFRLTAPTIRRAQQWITKSRIRVRERLAGMHGVRTWDGFSLLQRTAASPSIPPAFSPATRGARTWDGSSSTVVTRVPAARWITRSAPTGDRPAHASQRP